MSGAIIRWGGSRPHAHPRHGLPVDHLFYAGDQLQGSVVGPIAATAGARFRSAAGVEGDYEPLMLNVDNEGRVKVFGVVVLAEKFIADQAADLKKELRAAGDSAPKELPVPVVLRVDKGTRFHLVNHIIKLCQENGYVQFSLSAMTGKDEGGR